MLHNAKTNSFIKQSLQDLKNKFSGYGLPISNSKTDKYLNDKVSSAYHKWQRDQLGRSLVVSDIDLVNIKNGSLFAFYELKRSYKSLEEWQPHRDDYPNFILLSKLAQKSGLLLRIAYNVRTKNPWYDNISKIKVFEFKHGNPVSIKDRGIYSLSDFLNL